MIREIDRTPFFLFTSPPVRMAMDMEKIARRVTLDLTAHLRLGDEMRAAGLHRQAACYDLFLEGRIPYDIMVRHFGRQHAAAFRKHAGIWDKVKQLGGKTRKIVQDQLGKWQQKLTESVAESLPALRELRAIENEGQIETKKSLWQKALDTFANNVMDDYKESLAALKDDQTSLNEFVERMYAGAMQKAKAALGRTLPAYLVAFLFGGPVAVGAMFFRKALFRAAKTAIKAGDYILRQQGLGFGEQYGKNVDKIKELAKDKVRRTVMGVMRRFFKSKEDAGEKIGAGIAFWALAVKAGKNTKEALQSMHGYIEKKYGKNWADGVANILKALVIGGVVREGAGAIGTLAEWFAEDPEMSGMGEALKGGGKMVLEDPDTGEILGEIDTGAPSAEDFLPGSEEGIGRMLGTNVVERLPGGNIGVHLGGEQFYELDQGTVDKMEAMQDKYSRWLESDDPRQRLGAQNALRMKLKSLILNEGERIAPDDLPPALSRTLGSIRETSESIGEGF